MFFVPGDGAVDGIDDVLDFAEAVAFAGVADENGFGSDVLEGDEKLLGFGDGDVVVVFAVQNQSRGVRGGHMLQGGALPGDVHQVALMEELAEFHFLILVVVGHVVVADEIDDAGGGNGGFEFVGLGDEPLGELAAVADALDAHALTIDPQVAAHRRADTVQNILGFVAVLIAKDGVGELLAVTGRAAIVDVQDGVAMRGVDLIFDIERGAVLAVRAAVNVHDERMLRGGGHAERLGEEGFDFKLVVVAGEGEGFDFGELFSGEKLGIQVGELAGRAVTGLEKKFGRVAR